MYFYCLRLRGSLQTRRTWKGAMFNLVIYTSIGNLCEFINPVFGNLRGFVTKTNKSRKILKYLRNLKTFLARYTNCFVFVRI